MKINEEAFKIAKDSLTKALAHQENYDIMHSRCGTQEDKIALADSAMLRRFLLAYLNTSSD